MPGAEIAIAHSTPWYVAAGVGILLLPVVFLTLWKHIQKARAELSVLDLNSQQNSIFKTSIDEVSRRLDEARSDRAAMEQQNRDLLKLLADLNTEVFNLKTRISEQDTQLKLQAEAMVNQARELADYKVKIQDLTQHIEAMGGPANATI